MPFWRRESLHERLAREGGLTTAPPAHDTQPRWGEAGIHGVHRPREWDAVVTAEAPDLAGDQVEFVVLADGSLLVDEEVDAGPLEPLAAALDGVLAPPYRAIGIRRGGETWAVGARRIEIAELPEDVAGDQIVLSVAQGERTLTVDGAAVFGGIPALERLGAERYESFVLRASRLDATLWEVSVSPL